MKTIEENVLIAEFMGYEKVLSSYNLPQHERNGVQCFFEYELQFHSSWEWLMTVVEKIESMSGVYVDINGRFCTIGRNGSAHASMSIERTFEEVKFIRNYDAKKLRAIYDSVVEFIKLYNKNQ